MRRGAIPDPTTFDRANYINILSTSNLHRSRDLDLTLTPLSEPAALNEMVVRIAASGCPLVLDMLVQRERWTRLTVTGDLSPL